MDNLPRIQDRIMMDTDIMGRRSSKFEVLFRKCSIFYTIDQKYLIYSVWHIQNPMPDTSIHSSP